jgi:transcriptional regulator with XRE-family HTH domain
MIDLPTPEERKAEAQRLLDGLTGAWVAERMDRDRNTIALWKSGKRIPDLEDLLRLPGATNRPLTAQMQERLVRYIEGVRSSAEDEVRAADEAVAEVTRRLDDGSGVGQSVVVLDTVEP